jgi:protein gp37
MQKAQDGKYWDRAWSIIENCTPVSEACDHCWLMSMNKRFRPNASTAVRVREDRLELPLEVRKTTVWAIWSDLFHESVPNAFIERAMNIMHNTLQHTFLVLTKRPQRMSDFFLGTSGAGANFEYPNIWFGTTVENQAAADERIPLLLTVPGKRFLSVEPMLGLISLLRWLPIESCSPSKQGVGIGLVICGGESGPGARPMHPEWVRSLRDQCHAAGVPFFFKQWGEWYPDKKAITQNKREMIFGDTVVHKIGTRAAGRILDGRTHDDLPWRRTHK